MPYKSRAQMAYFNANRAKLEKQGVNVDEWNEASKGMKLPMRRSPLHELMESGRKDTRSSHSRSYAYLTGTQIPTAQQAQAAGLEEVQGAGQALAPAHGRINPL